jgi:hypothetical protein
VTPGPAVAVSVGAPVGAAVPGVNRSFAVTPSQARVEVPSKMNSRFRNVKNWAFVPLTNGAVTPICTNRLVDSFQ